MNVRNLESKTEKFVAQTINGFSIKVFVNIDTYVGPTTYGSSIIDFSKCNVKAILNRGGVDHILFQDNLKILGLASTVNTLGQLAFYAGTNDHGVKLGNGQALISFNLPLGGHIRMADTDYLYLEVNNVSGLIAAGYTIGSYMEIKPLQSVGYEQFIPSIKTFNIQATTTSDNYSLGDATMRTVLVNYDKTDYTSPCVASLNFTSDRLNQNFNFADLVNFKTVQYGVEPVGLITNQQLNAEFPQMFLLTDFNQRYNKTSLQVQYNSANITAGTNYIVCWSSNTSWTILQKAASLQKKHQVAARSAVPAK